MSRVSALGRCCCAPAAPSAPPGGALRRLLPRAATQRPAWLFPCARPFASAPGPLWSPRPGQSSPGRSVGVAGSWAAAGGGGGAAAAGGDKPQVVVLTGPTGVGKTNTALSLAEAIGGEIISADSVQVYRGLDVGSDKLPPGKRRGIPHHLLDVLDLDPTREFSAGDFYEEARAATEDILQRGKVPIVTGGTGFYLQWFLHGKPNTPRSTPETSAAAEAAIQCAIAAAEAGAEGPGPFGEAERWAAGAAALAAAGDPATAAALPANDWYRLRRAMEILIASGGQSRGDLVSRPPHVAEREGFKSPPVSDGEEAGGAGGDGAAGAGAGLDYDFRCFFVTRPRLELYRSIDARVEAMFQRGLLEEAMWMLEEKGVGPESCAPARAIGYKQSLDLLAASAERGSCGREDLVACVREVQKQTRNFSTRQLTWFRKNQLFQWVKGNAGPEVTAARIAAQLLGPPEGAVEGLDDRRGVLSKDEAGQAKRYRPREVELGGGGEAARLVGWVEGNLGRVAEAIERLPDKEDED